MYSLQIVLEAYELYKKTKSYALVSLMLRNKYGISIVDRTIGRWFNKTYAEVVNKRLTPKYC